MSTNRVVLIGHSAAGKSVCIVELGIDRNNADMDVAFKEDDVPALDALRWCVSDERPAVLVAYNRQHRLADMITLKRSGSYADLFAKLQFVYLRKPVTELQHHLSLPTTGGTARIPAHIQYTINEYHSLDALYTQLADLTIDCSQKATLTVAEEIRAIVNRDD
jgi:hypothetical protein